MILQIIQILLISLGFHNTKNNNPKSLYRQPEYKPLKINPIVFLLLFTLGIILFALFVLLFMPGNDTAIVYNQFNTVI